jgi:HlyD family secretion protein
MSASVDIYTHTAEQILSVPLIAVTARSEENKTEDAEAEGKEEQQETEKASDLREIVFVVSGDTVTEKLVKTGIQDNDYIEIFEGLSEGQTLVTGPYSAISRKLESGTRIRITDKKKTTEKKD